MPYYEKGKTRIYYEEAGSGFPLLVIPGGGLNSSIAYLTTKASFDPMKVLSNEYRCITFDMRNSNLSRSSGPLEPDRPWDQHTDDHLGLMDHLGIDRFFVMGLCIGGPFIWNMLKRAPERVVAAVPTQPSGFRPEIPDNFYQNNIKGWAPELVAKRPDITMEMCETYLANMYRKNPDFVFSVTRDFVRSCQTPVLVMPDDTPPHPYAVAMETATLAPNGEATIFPWKESADGVKLAVRHLRTFLRAYRPG